MNVMSTEDQQSNHTPTGSLNWEYQRWQVVSNDGMTLIWMTDETLRKYIDAYLEVRGIKPETEKEWREERYKASIIVRRMSYWKGVQGDPASQPTSYVCLRSRHADGGLHQPGLDQARALGCLSAVPGQHCDQLL
jgi:hypothetical protein